MLGKRWSVVGVTAATLLLAGLVPAITANAAPGTSPTITVPTDSSPPLTASPISVSATVPAGSTATFVRFTLDPTGANITKDVPAVDDGTGTGGQVATGTLPAAGVDGATTLTAVACDGVVPPLDCDPTGDSVNLTLKLTAPQITAPSDGDIVSFSVPVAATTNQGGGINFLVDGHAVANGFVASPPYTATLDFTGFAEGSSHTISAGQCDDTGKVCQGPTSSVVTVTLDTQGATLSDPNALPKRFFNDPDHYLDSTRLVVSAGAAVTAVQVVITNHAGAVVRTISVPSGGPGLLAARWNGRNDAGKLVVPGRYRFHFQGADAHGKQSRSPAGHVAVSTKRLVRHHRSLRLTAVRSEVAVASETCGSFGVLTRFSPRPFYRHGLGYYSNFKCARGGRASLAGAEHLATLAKAFRYGKLRIRTLGERRRETADLPTSATTPVPTPASRSSSSQSWVA